MQFYVTGRGEDKFILNALGTLERDSIRSSETSLRIGGRVFEFPSELISDKPVEYPDELIEAVEKYNASTDSGFHISPGDLEKNLILAVKAVTGQKFRELRCGSRSHALNDALHCFCSRFSCSNCPIESDFLRSLHREGSYRETSKVLITFLKERGLYKNYVVNYLNQYRHRGRLYKYLLTKRESDFISSCFTWGLTPEGDSVWSSVDSDWRNYVSENNLSDW